MRLHLFDGAPSGALPVNRVLWTRVSQLLSYGAPTPALISRDLRHAVSLCFCPDVKNKVVTHEAASTRLLGRQRGPVGVKWFLPAVITLSQTAEMVPEAAVSGGCGPPACQ